MPDYSRSFTGLKRLDPTTPLLRLAPYEDLRIQGSLDAGGPMAEDVAVERVLDPRPDLLAARASEEVAAARLHQAATEARPDASFSVSYQRADSSFDSNGLNAGGQLRPVQGVFHFVAAGVSINLPSRNKNQGAIETAVAQGPEAKRRRSQSIRLEKSTTFFASWAAPCHGAHADGRLKVTLQSFRVAHFDIDKPPLLGDQV